MTFEDLTREELARTARAAIRCYFDVQTGHRPVEALRAILSPAAAQDLPALPEPQQPDQLALVRHGDLGPVSVLRLGSARVYACAATPASGAGQCATVAVELTADYDRVQVDRIGHIATGTNREAEVEHVPRVGDGQPPPPTPRHLSGLLGDLPTPGDAQARWLTAAAVIDTYRERYDIHDDRSALGPEPQDREQAAERQRAIDHTRALVREINRAEPDRGPSRDPTERDLGR